MPIISFMQEGYNLGDNMQIIAVDTIYKEFTKFCKIQTSLLRTVCTSDDNR